MSVESFDADLRSAYEAGGVLACAVQIARRCFGLDLDDPLTAGELLDWLQQPCVHEAIGWQQDYVLSPPQQLDGDLVMIASENQANWQAAHGADGTTWIGRIERTGWVTWHAIDLGELLLRLLAIEAVVGHGPCATSVDVPNAVLTDVEVLPGVVIAQGPAELVAVVATGRWFGVTVGTDARELYAAPVDRALSDLTVLAPHATINVLDPI